MLVAVTGKKSKTPTSSNPAHLACREVKANNANNSENLRKESGEPDLDWWMADHAAKHASFHICPGCIYLYLYPYLSILCCYMMLWDIMCSISVCKLCTATARKPCRTARQICAKARARRSASTHLFSWVVFKELSLDYHNTDT